MKKYKFKLQTVLDMREKVLNEKLLELSQLTAGLRIEQTNLINFKATQTRLNGELDELYKAEILDITKIGYYKQFLKKFAQLIFGQEDLIKKMENVVRLKQLEVSAAMQDKKVMEKLKEKEEKKYYGHIDYLERQEIDDLAISRYKGSQG